MSRATLAGGGGWCQTDPHTIKTWRYLSDGTKFVIWLRLP